MKYKIGDRVRIKTWEKLRKEFGIMGSNHINTYLTFFYEIEKNLKNLNTDRIVTIKSIVIYNNQIFGVKEFPWRLSDDIIECLEEKSELIKNRWEILDIR